MKSTAGGFDDHLWIVAMIARSRYDRKFMTEQILGTLYGVAAITETDENGDSRRRRCLYFSESAFHKYADVDGAIVIGPDGAAMYVNDFGREQERVYQSGLARFLIAHNAYYDKHTMEQRADCLVADFELDRRDPKTVYERVAQKYADRRLTYTKWHHCEGIGIVVLPSP